MNLYPYQKKAANDAYVLGSHMLLCDCGTGKTVIELSIIRHRLLQGEIKRCLIVAPLSILWSSWESDIKKFYPDLQYEIFWDAKRDTRLQSMKSFDKQIAIINYDVVVKYFENLLDLNFDMIVTDESTRIKNHAAPVSKCTLALGRIARYQTAMTATPGHKPEHYWSQLKFISTINESFSSFRSRFCYPVKLGDTGMVKWAPAPENESLLKDLISRKAIRLSKAECLDLPSKTFSVREVFLPDKAMALYKQMLKESVVTVENEVIMAQFPGILSQKLRQIANGILYAHETGNRYRIHDAKLKEVDSILDMTDGQIIIWANFQEDVKILTERYDAIAFYGGTVDKRQAEEDFLSGKKRIIVAHPASAGHGKTWVNSHIQIYYALPPLELFLQTQDRIHRIGQTLPCTYYVVIAKNTVDQLIWAHLQVQQCYQENLISFARANLSYNNKYTKEDAVAKCDL